MLLVCFLSIYLGGGHIVLGLYMEVSGQLAGVASLLPLGGFLG